MRRTVVFLTLVMLAAPFAAAAATRSPGDGVMSVRDLDGTFIVSARGTVIGRCTSCVLFVDDRTDAATINPVVVGARGVDDDGDGDKDLYVGKNLRFKVIGGSFLVRITKGNDVDLTVAGRGWVRIRGTAGLYTLNGSDPLPVTPANAHYALRASTTP